MESEHNAIESWFAKIAEESASAMVEVLNGKSRDARARLAALYDHSVNSLPPGHASVLMLARLRACVGSPGLIDLREINMDSELLSLEFG